MNLNNRTDTQWDLTGKEIETLVTLYWINDRISSLLSESYRYLCPLPKREFSIAWDYVFLWKKWTVWRKIDTRKFSSSLENNILRELAFRLWSRNDWYLASDVKVLEFLELLLKKSWDERWREALIDVHNNYERLVSDQIPVIHLQRDKKYERKATELRDKYVKWLELNERELELLESFSWEWKTTHRGNPNYNLCWVITVCIKNMIDLWKE